MSFGCFETEEIEIFEQEGIDYFKKNSQFLRDYQNKLKLFEKGENRLKIPLVTHQIYLTNTASPKKMDKISINKTIRSIELLNQSSKQFKHFIWVNSFDIVPEEIRSLPRVEIRYITELASLEIWDSLSRMLDSEELASSIFAKASDLIRYSVLYLYGGLYRDLDYEIYKPEEFISLLNNFDLFVGKEFDDHEPVYAGSALVASVAKHPVIEKALELLKRNLNSDVNELPEYLQYPCDTLNHQLYQTGPAVITMAFFIAANQDGYNDVLLPPNILYNWEYAKASTPDSSCHVPGKNIELNPATIGADMFCGNWHKNNFRYYYKRNVDYYLYFAAQNGNIKMVERSISDGADVNKIFQQTGVTPLYIAVQNGYIEIAKKLIDAGASIWFRSKGGLTIKRASLISGNPEIINFISEEYQKILDSTELGCFQGDIEDVFIQEDINYKIEDKKLVESAKEKYSNIDQYMKLNKNPINKASHQIYLSFNSKEISEILTEKTKISLQRLNNYNQSWSHFIWTNNKSIVPQELLNIQGVKLRYINELVNNEYFYLLEHLLELSKDDPLFLNQASDVLRLIILLQEGGVYRDFDYEIYRAKELEELLQAFNFIAGKERYSEVSYVGNAFIASTKNHPIIATALNDYIKRNFDLSKDLLPLYLKYPCNKSVKVIFETGSPVITSSYFKSANQNGNFDLIMPANVFYNIKYAWENTPKSRCYLPTKLASLDEIIEGELVKTIGSDLFCGSWHSLKLIEHPGNENIYLYMAAQEGNYQNVERLLANGASPNSFLKFNSVTSLAIASQNGFFDIVKLLVENGADVNLTKDGYTPLYRAVQEERYNIAQYLIDKSADINYVQANGLTSLFYAVYKNWPKMVNLLIKNNADQQIKFNGDTAYEYALKKGYHQVSEEFQQREFNQDNDYKIEINQIHEDIIEKLIGNSEYYFAQEI